MQLIAAIQREMLAGGFDIPQVGCLWIGVINWFPESKDVGPSALVHLRVGFVNQLPHI